MFETYKVQATVVSSGANWHQSVPQNHLTADKDMENKTNFTHGTCKIFKSFYGHRSLQLISFSCGKLEMLNLREAQSFKSY